MTLSYFAAQRECQNAALLQMMRASLDQAAAVEAALAAGEAPPPGGPVEPVLVLPEPDEMEGATHNVMSFAEEVRANRAKYFREIPELVRMGPMPRFAQCYGWLRVSRATLEERMPRRIQPRGVFTHKEHRYLQEGQDEFYAIVYEYIRSGGGCENSVQEAGEVAGGSPRPEPPPPPPKPAGNDPDQVLAINKYLHVAGFQFCLQPLARNWKNNVLVDHSDIVFPRSYAWQRTNYQVRTVENLLAE